MPRRARVFLPGVPLHLTQRGHYRQQCFHCNGDFLHFLDLLRKYSHRMDVALHAYVLMSNHFHLLASFSPVAPPGEFMKAVLQCYTQYFNRRRALTGTLWQDRYHSCHVTTDRYLMVCHHYIELNPVRAYMVESADQYCWSSYRANAGLAEDTLLRPHVSYLSLGTTAPARGDAYRSQFRQPSDDDIVELRRATNMNTSTGVPRARYGRPPKQQ